MEKFGKSQPVKRVEDVRFLKGEGRYIDDTAPADALVAYFLRSDQAHGDISELDLSDVREAPGVPVVDRESRLRGMVTERDFMRLTAKLLDQSMGEA